MSEYKKAIKDILENIGNMRKAIPSLVMLEDLANNNCEEMSSEVKTVVKKLAEGMSDLISLSLVIQNEAKNFDLDEDTNK